MRVQAAMTLPELEPPQSGQSSESSASAGSAKTISPIRKAITPRMATSTNALSLEQRYR
jgi:hypothetical protein